MFPLHCVVESLNSGGDVCLNCCVPGGDLDSTDSQTIVDSYAIISTGTPLSQLVETVLLALGLPHLTPHAKGRIRVLNWKALGFDQISDDPEIPVDQLLKDLSNHITLHILTKASSSGGGAASSNADTLSSQWALDAKSALLKVSLAQNPNLLNTIADQEVKSLAEQLCSNSVPQPEDAALLQRLQSWCHRQIRRGQMSSSSIANQNRGTPTTKFNHFMEVPKLDRWFQENPNPSRSKLLTYMHILNGSNFRKHSAKITYQQICNYFSNARALQRKEHGVVSKVFANNVRGTTMDFNAFIRQKSGAGAASGIELEPGPDGEILADGLMMGEEAKSMLGVQENGAGNGTTSSGKDSVSPKHELSESAITSLSPGNQSQTLSPLPDHSTGSPRGESEPEDMGGFGEMEEGDSFDEEIGGRIKQEMENGTENENGEEEDMKTNPNCISGDFDDSDGLKTGAGDFSLPLMISAAPHLATPGGPSPNPSSSPGIHNAHRTRLMFDPLSEIPLLEKWFEDNPHPSWMQIDQYTETLNAMSYRQTYPPVTQYNVKIWFKNRRAKSKRLTMHNAATGGGAHHHHSQSYHEHIKPATNGWAAGAEQLKQAAAAAHKQTLSEAAMKIMLAYPADAKKL